MTNRKILIVKNISHEDEGLFGGMLKEKGIPYDVVDLSLGEKFPNPENHAAVMVFGGPDSANDDTEKMKEELKRIKEILDAGIPFMGICLGMQTLVKAAGGNVRKNDVKEAGCRDLDRNYFEINLTEEGRKDPLFQGIDSKLRTFHLHGETVDLTQQMTLLAAGKYCKNQVAKIGKNAYGIQGHPELTDDRLKVWIAKNEDLRKLGPALMEDYMYLKPQLERNARKILNNFLEIAKIVPMEVSQ